MKGLFRKVIIFLVLSGSVLITCEKPERVASIKTVDITDTDISYNSAILKGDLIDLGSEPIEDYGIIVSENASFLDPVPKSGSGTAKKGVFQIEFTGLIKNTTYYYKAYVTVNSDPIYGGSKSFKTKDTQPPTVTTGSATSVTETSATLNGTVNANDLSTTVTFEYGLTDSYGSEVTADQSPVTGSTATAVSTDLSSLTASTTYHYRVKAVSTGGTTYGDDMEFTTASTLPTVSDYDGNEYNIITIGTQEWIQENLKTTHYNNGEIIPNVTGNTEWEALTSGAYCWYDNDEATYKNTYGALYNWYTTIDVRNLCPAGWHVPTDAEWTTLTDYLGGESVAGGKLKETGTDHWTSPNTGATNETDFTALPGGSRDIDGIFYSIGNFGILWSTTEVSASYVWRQIMYYNTSSFISDENNKKDGFSVRCIKGELPLTKIEDATSVTATSASLNGQVNPNNASTTVTFEYGLTDSYGSEVTASESPVTGSTPASVSADISSLSETTTYHYRIKAVNTDGTTYSTDMTFTTLALTPPTATTGSATLVTSSSATLNGTVNANDLSTTVTFEYGLTDLYGSEVIADESPVTGTTATAVSYDLSDLTASTTYHYRVKAVSSGGTTYGDDMEFITAPDLPTVSDYDGNEYIIVTIGSQEWLQENLKTSHYSNGDVIANITDNTEWSGLKSGAYCWYDNNEGTYKETYGALYNWYTTVDVRNICPAGWHVPIDAEWTTLTDYLGGESVAGGKLKETGTEHWLGVSPGTTNESEFTALPGGYRDNEGLCSHIGLVAIFWSSSEYEYSDAWDRKIPKSFDYIIRENLLKENGVSIRCIKGELPLVQTDTAIAVASESATLKGIVNPNGASTTVAFEYGTTTAYGSTVTADQSPASGSGPVDVSTGLISLTPGTTYHYRIKAENSGGTNYGSDMEFTTPAQVSDVDGNTYNTVIIGTQTWMQENLKTTKYKNSNSIPLVTDGGTWSGLTTPAYCWYNNDKTTYGDVYGALYNWYTVNTGNLCPAGWHIPTDAEWTTLDDYLIANGYNYDGTTTGYKTAKSLASDTGWNPSSNEGAVGNTDYPDKMNITGFTALPSGINNGTFFNIGSTGYWWSSTEYSATAAWCRIIWFNCSGLQKTMDDQKTYGFSVRCIKD